MTEHRNNPGTGQGGERRNHKGRQRSRGQNRSGQPRQFSKAAPSQRRRSADPARLTAFRVLRAVSRDDAYANLVLPAEIRRAKLDKRDAGFATELTYGTLRAHGTYDQLLAQCVDRELSALDPSVLDALRLGAHQLLAMRVNTHAAVNETVGLVRDQIGAGPGGLVNAVLRRLSEKTFDEWITELTQGQSEEEAVALRHAHPAWVVRALKQALRLHGRGDDLADLLAADNAAPEIHLVGLPGMAEEAGQKHLAAAVEHGAVPSQLIDGAAVFRGGDVGRLDGVREGQLRVQDIGSQWIARALAEPAVQPAEKWLDLCAGPGGKASLLAALAAEFDVTLTANEPAPHRAELVRKALSPVAERAWNVRTGDGRTIGQDAPGPYDRIIVDAPCTGLGALRRRPESRWRRRPSDLAELTVLQEQLLDTAADVLAPEGFLAYVTCSPHPAETVAQVQDLLRRRPELELLDAHEVMADVALPQGAELINSRPAVTDPTAARCVQLWPHIHGTDAMFFALLQKTD
ncbi:RsmB/NOP family class I SAM-dependent RNA methyltransferase [Nesterenkonia flava]|uniref:Transcription antitermination factor NusB n=1 Tax=Nesterenkonia flava TaxID=469799 RepID=A0ABU1FV65_9MICC|nr:transcription antitermination factor NusB [Nesterenkonia flava]MDR5712559.1 transcription antitermination factor NusB [Nesterenkonia flava]